MIISASYKTDIPAFYGQWFMNRLRAGHCRMVKVKRRTHPGAPHQLWYNGEINHSRDHSIPRPHR